MAYAIIDLNTGETIEESAPLVTKPLKPILELEPLPELQLEIVQTDPPKRPLHQERPLTNVTHKKEKQCLEQ